MENGKNDYSEIIIKGYKAVRQMAACGLSHSAKDVKNLLYIIATMDKNQKALIQTVLKLQRQNKSLRQLAKRMYSTMNNGQKDVVDIWLKRKDREL